MKGERKKPGPKPGFKREAAAAAVATTVIAAAQASAAVEPAQAEPATRFPNPLQRHRDIDTMPEAELRAYALQIGITPRDASTVGVERLRVNCKHQVYALIDDL